MTTTEVRYHRYSDHRGKPVWVRATRVPGSAWQEHWTTQQLMAVDLSHEPDTQERCPVAYRTAPEPLDGSKSRRTIPNSPNSPNPNR